MRTIKFRGKRKDNKEWVEGWLYHDQVFDGITTCLDVMVIRDELDGDYIIIPETVGQLVSFPDSDLLPLEIYEGDIIRNFTQRWTYDPEEMNKKYPNYFLVSIDEAYQKIVLTEIGLGECWIKGYTEDAIYETFESCEVIGNIHDNPELLK